MTAEEAAKQLGIAPDSWLYQDFLKNYYDPYLYYSTVDDPHVGKIIMKRELSGKWQIVKMPSRLRFDTYPGAEN